MPTMCQTFTTLSQRYSTERVRETDNKQKHQQGNQTGLSAQKKAEQGTVVRVGLGVGSPVRVRDKRQCTHLYERRELRLFISYCAGASGLEINVYHTFKDQDLRF